ncbi:MAG: hypothetical protein AABZ47_18410 [Planctomycetota bacterium]
MALSVTFVSGLRRSGKSAVIQMMVDQLWKAPPHYLRMVLAGGDKLAPKRPAKPPDNCGVASARWVEYDSEHIFEVLPNTLALIHRGDRYGSVVIEADADPALRPAYPYDHRVFTMPLPATIDEVFRDPTDAADELKKALDDTAAFASEIFGMLSRDASDDFEPREERADLTSTQMRGFLYSPLGDELATRILLRQPYHGLLESDVIIVNTASGRRGVETDECLHRISHLLERLRVIGERRGELFICDLAHPDTKVLKLLLKALKPMCHSGK